MALTSIKVSNAKWNEMLFPAISARLTIMASIPAKEAITELITNPEFPNNIRQVL